MQVVQRVMPWGGIEQLLLKELGSFLQDDAKCLACFGFAFGFRAERRKRYTGLFCQVVQSLAKVPAFALHDEAKYITASIALTETAPGLGFGEDHKSLCARVAVKWAEAGVILPCAAQLHCL